MKRRKHSFARGLITTLLIFAVLFGGALLLIQGIEKNAGEAETEIVYEAVRSAMLTCYAVEGVYPAELDYLKENNVMPEIRVMERGALG